MNKYYAPKERTVKQIVDEIENHPNSDPDVIADRVARTLISNKLYS